MAKRFLAAIICIIAIAGAVRADDIFDRLMSPGPLSKAHEKLEGNCKNCHKPLDKTGQTKLCRDCHKPIDLQIAKQNGYHGKDPRARTSACRVCHTEHKGRSAQVTIFDRDVFNHDLTDYPLKGGHQKIACSSCHAAKAKFSAAPTACVNCHKDDDPHHGRLGPNCASCHNEQSWKTGKFDHNTTHFPLKGGHAATSCESCHPDQRFQKTPTDCFSCHQLDDKHKGANGRACENCHTAVKWATVTFDHSKTRFPLTGQHAMIACKACHASGDTPKKLPLTCISCHQKDDVHKGGNGPKCETCHSAATWKKSTFNHNTETDFPLKGAHVQTTCKSCHRSGAFTKKIERTCFSCHQNDDAHKGQEGRQCETCHNEVSWGGKVRFDHGLTRFPLVGLHATTSCEQCHLTASYKDAPKACNDCHKKDDKHKGTLGPKCADCHNPNGWRYWQFDHDKQTDFALTGKHAGLACKACHVAKTDDKATASSACVSCHRSEDIHRGEFGDRCDTCHTTDGFSKL